MTFAKQQHEVAAEDLVELRHVIGSFADHYVDAEALQVVFFMFIVLEKEKNVWL